MLLLFLMDLNSYLFSTYWAIYQGAWTYQDHAPSTHWGWIDSPLLPLYWTWNCPYRWQRSRKSQHSDADFSFGEASALPPMLPWQTCSHPTLKHQDNRQRTCSTSGTRGWLNGGEKVYLLLHIGAAYFRHWQTDSILDFWSRYPNRWSSNHCSVLPQTIVSDKHQINLSIIPCAGSLAMDTYLYSTDSEPPLENSHADIEGEAEGGINWESSFGICTYVYR